MVFSATKYLFHPDGAVTYHTYDNFGESHHGTFSSGNNSSGSTLTGLGKVTRYADGTHTISTFQVQDSKKGVKEQENISNSILANTRYIPVRSFASGDQTANGAINRHFDFSTGTTTGTGAFGNFGIWIIVIIIVIIIIVIIAWAFRGGRRRDAGPGYPTGMPAGSDWGQMAYGQTGY